MQANEASVADAIRDMIVRSEIPAGERITESRVASLLGVSRTPARGALRSLEMEGLVEKRDGRGYRVRDIDMDDLPNALKVRGVLEGLAARTLAEQGLGRRAADRLEKSLAATAALVAGGMVDQRGRETYRVANAIFHETIVRECGNDFVGYVLERLKPLPTINRAAFPSPDEGERALRMRMTIGHAQHKIIHHAIRSRDGARAEAMMREHANAAAEYSELFGG